MQDRVRPKALSSTQYLIKHQSNLEENEPKNNFENCDVRHRQPRINIYNNIVIKFKPETYELKEKSIGKEKCDEVI